MRGGVSGDEGRKGDLSRTRAKRCLGRFLRGEGERQEARELTPSSDFNEPLMTLPKVSCEPVDI